MLEHLLKYWHWWNGYALMMFAVLLFAASFWKTHAPIVTLSIAWTGHSALWVFANPISPYVNESAAWITVLDLAAATTLAPLLLYILASRALTFLRWSLIFQGVAIVNALWICMGWFWGKPWGVLLSPSMSGCLSAALLPLFFHGRTYPIFSITLVTASVFFAGQSQPIGMLVILAGVALFRMGYRKGTVALAILSVPVGFLVAGPRLLETTGRMNIWRWAWDWWSIHANPFMGSGLGTFFAIGPTLTREVSFTFLHSDWLQILFEQGLIGFVLVSMLFIGALWKAHKGKQSTLFYCVLGYGLFGLANMPLHYPISALFGAVLFNQVYRVKP